MTTVFESTPGGGVIIGRWQDVSAIIEKNKILQNESEVTKEGIRNGWWLYFQLPNIIIEKFRNEYGVDVYNRDHQPKVFELVNRPEYRYLKTTTKRHTVR